MKTLQLELFTTGSRSWHTRRLALLGATLIAVAIALVCLDPGARSAEPGQLDHSQVGPARSELDLAGLTEGVRVTRAIGLLAKLEIKQKTELFLNDMQQFHDGDSSEELTSLRERFDALLSWLVALVQPGDPELHDQLVASRDALWHTLTNSATFREQPHHVRHMGNNRGR